MAIVLRSVKGSELTHAELDGNFTELAARALPVFDLATYATVSGSYYAGWQSAMAALEAAGGGILQLPAGVIDIDGALQDTGRANAQLLLPSRHAVNAEQITVVIRGVRPPPTTFSVIGTTPLPDNHSVIRSTLTAGSGGNLLGCRGPAGSFSDFSNVNVVLRDVTFRLPANPTHSGVDLSHVTGCNVDEVVIDTGSYWVQSLTQPTTATSYGIKFPKNNNGADTRIGCLNVFGFYTGAQIAEHTNAEQMNFWGCLRALESAAMTNHASHIKRLMTVHCARGIVASGGAHYLDVEQFNIEHAASGWWAPVYDIDDASNLLRGRVRWHVVLAGVGVDGTFLVNGAEGVEQTRVGFPASPATKSPTTSYTAIITDAGKLIRMNAAAANTFTVPPNSSAAFPVGTELHIQQAGVGATALGAGAGVTISRPASQTLTLKEQYAVATLKKVGTDAWIAFGMLGAV